MLFDNNQIKRGHQLESGGAWESIKGEWLGGTGRRKERREIDRILFQLYHLKKKHDIL